ncbi:MAG: ABC transporter ATP-binding protein [Sphingobacteriia bacterium]|jgi:ABC-2 type transport system ATP-binding protein|nr:MAG: ABC transporter ATP-binding protein [Sphingobacteriia bacterium]TAG30147.1 MAG: ABC transporter ATP-binding protein [Sphingobacteriia bacterium]
MIISGIGLSKSYGKRKVLDKVNIECSAGEICGLLGANGAGKTTLFKILFGLITPDSGKVILPNNHIKPIGGIIEKPALYEYLNAWDNIDIFASIQGMKCTPSMIEQILLKVGLPTDRKDGVGNYSMGMKQRLGIAIALLNNPACLVLDEPFTGLDPLGVAALRKLIADLAREEKLAIILSSHIIEELSKICHTLCVLKDGKMVNAGPAQQLIADNTDTFSICAVNIQSSLALRAYKFELKGNCAYVKIAADKVPDLVQELYKESIYITACTPELSMEKLFEITDL